MLITCSRSSRLLHYDKYDMVKRQNYRNNYLLKKTTYIYVLANSISILRRLVVKMFIIKVNLAEDDVMELWIQINNLVQIKLCIINKSTRPFFVIMWSVFWSQNLPFRPRIYPLLNIYMRPSQNLPSLSEYNPLLNIYMRPSQTVPPSQNIHPPFEHLRSIWDPPRIYTSLPEYTRLLYKATLLVCTLPLLSQLHVCATLPWFTPPSHNIPLPF